MCENFPNLAVDWDSNNIISYLESLNTWEWWWACFVWCTFKESESWNWYDLTMMHAWDATWTVVNNWNILYETVDHSQVSKLNQQWYINQNQTNVHPKANIVDWWLIEEEWWQWSIMHRWNLEIMSMQVTSWSVVFMASDGLTNLLRHNFSWKDDSREIIKELSAFQSVKEINDAIKWLLSAWKDKWVWTSSNWSVYDLTHQDNNEVREWNTDFVPRYDTDNISFMVVRIP